MKLSGVSIFPENRGENLKLNVAVVFESKIAILVWNHSDEEIVLMCVLWYLQLTQKDFEIAAVREEADMSSQHLRAQVKFCRSVNKFWM